MAGPNTPYFYRSGGGSSSAGSGGTGKNYLTTYKASTGSGASNPGNGDIELGSTTGFSKGTTGTLTNAIPTGSPTFGSGANANLSIATASSSQIAGIYSLDIISAAATTAGDMVSTDAFFIDAEDQAKVLSFKIAYKAQTNPTNGNWSGTSSNSYGVAAYDVTNSSWLPVAGNFNFTQSTGVGICSGTFQTNSTTASIRLMIYNATASAGAITLRTDDWSCGPQVSVNAPAMTDSGNIPWTPTGAWSTNTTYTGSWRRVGECAEIQVNVATSGAPDSATLLINLPTGLVIDTTKLSASTAGITILFSQGDIDDSGTTFYQVAASYQTTTSIRAKYLSVTTHTYANVTQAAPVTFGAGDSVYIKFIVPIVGWSSNSVQSSDTDTRVVAAIVSGDPASATVGNPLIVPTVGYDSHGAYNATTGRYTVPVSGIYKLYGALQSASSATTLTIYKNAVSNSLAGNLDSNGEATYASAVSCVAGDIIDIRPGGTVDATSMTLNIERLSGPAVIAATESVNARYHSVTATVTGSFSLATYTTKDIDSHSSYSSGTYTIPVSGTYIIGAQAVVNAANVAGNADGIAIYLNGVSYAESYYTAETTITRAYDLEITDTVKCVAGDLVTIRVLSTGTTPTITASAVRNKFYLQRVGN